MKVPGARPNWMIWQLGVVLMPLPPQKLYVLSVGEADKGQSYRLIRVMNSQHQGGLGFALVPPIRALLVWVGALRLITYSFLT